MCQSTYELERILCGIPFSTDIPIWPLFAYVTASIVTVRSPISRPSAHFCSQISLSVFQEYKCFSASNNLKRLIRQPEGILVGWLHYCPKFLKEAMKSDTCFHLGYKLPYIVIISWIYYVWCINKQLAFKDDVGNFMKTGVVWLERKEPSEKFQPDHPYQASGSTSLLLFDDKIQYIFNDVVQNTNCDSFWVISVVCVLLCYEVFF